MIATSGAYAGQPIILACDAQCNKAWGINNRPRIYVGDPTLTIYPKEKDQWLGDGSINEDDYFFLADSELGFAPVDPGTGEGDEFKPLIPAERLNKWCCRECERSIMVDNLDIVKDFQLPDFNVRRYNISTSDPKNAGAE
jgi:hypothetical protein